MKEAQVNWLKTLMQSAKNAGGRLRRPVQIVLIGTLLVALGLVISGCNVTGSETSGVSGVTFQWTSPSHGTISGTQTLDVGWWNNHTPQCQTSNLFTYDLFGLWGSTSDYFDLGGYPLFVDGRPVPFSKNVYVPATTAAAGGDLHILIHSYDRDFGYCQGDSLDQWSEIIAIPPYSGQVYANLFTHASPAGEAGTIIDARLSSGGANPYTYAFTPSNCAGTNAPSSGPPLPNGEASVAPGFSGTCTVTVTDAKGTTSTASVPVTAGFSGNTGSFSFSNGSATISVTNLVSGGTACVDLSGGANYQTQVPLVWNAYPLAAEGSVGLLATTPGIHEITAQIYSNSNENCANPNSQDLLQTIADLYQGNGAALLSARRAATAHGIQLLAAHPKRYTARSSLRFAPKKTVKVGTENLALGQFKGGIVNGAFTWTSPRRAKGITRPAGLSALVHGTYVMQSNAMYFGPPRGDATALIGTGTVLFRGIGNSYECAQITSTLDGSVLTLLGGQGASAKLNGSVTTATVTYKLPFFTKKAKPPLPKASGKTGTVIASTGRKGLALPTICRNLKKYLP